MTPATSTRRTTSAIINALIAAVEGVQLPGPTPAAGDAFGRVEFFDAEKIADAFQYLLITEQRVCVLVPLEERFETIINQSILVVKRKLPVLLMISDRVIGSNKRKVALLGDDTTPGAQGLVDLTLPAVTGILIASGGGLSGIKSVPVDSTVMTINDKDQAKLPGRLCICLELECTGGVLQTNIGPGPIL